jgi:hypothetical protein
MTDPTPKRKCTAARYWGNGRRAWRCNLLAEHESKHYDPVRRMFWGDVIATHGVIR